MHAQLDELLAARDQMAQLLRVIVEIGSDLDLDGTLRRIVTAARELTAAPTGPWPSVIPRERCCRSSTRG
ncbi:two-component sensor histidine kinase domain protein [Mycobacterium kansasii]|uniref:Two-component sensor histidine kinase domain protein n=1 Tax=Mycobacterium kansasii TaxID=1768 RepID=A0A1V3WY85_MYCKA|nr:two-component sensor histidine kinase domain protein [Mycobacterium kansasii]